jgi:hypothetical protein
LAVVFGSGRGVSRPTSSAMTSRTGKRRSLRPPTVEPARSPGAHAPDAQPPVP